MRERFARGTFVKGTRYAAVQFRPASPISMRQPQKIGIALVVEDEWLLRMEIAEALAEAGWQVIEAGSGERAVALIGRDPLITLLVTDIRLPGAISGFDVAERFRVAYPNLPVVYTSANPRNELRHVTGSVFLSKPCHMEILVATCRDLCRKVEPPAT